MDPNPPNRPFPGLLQAVERFCQEEAEMTSLEMEALDEHGPFRRGNEGG